MPNYACQRHHSANSLLIIITKARVKFKAKWFQICLEKEGKREGILYV